MSKAIAINVAANTNLPGVRGPIYPDGSFVYLPIPEREPVAKTADVPTYGDLLAALPALPFELPPATREQLVHLDPEFASYPGCSEYTYGDEHGVKAGPLSELSPGDSLLFYATLTRHEPPASVETGPSVDWVSPDWGAYLIGEFRVERVLDRAACDSLSAPDRSMFATNAHCKRESFDAQVLVRGAGDSRLFEHAIPLSTAETGSAANPIVTDLSNDSGRGPWWRRRLWFDTAATNRLRKVIDCPPTAYSQWACE